MEGVGGGEVRVVGKTRKGDGDTLYFRAIELTYINT